jgi:hypothetical protein
MVPFVVAAVALAVFAGAGVFLSADEKKPEHTIKEIMKTAHAGLKKSLRYKVINGQAEKADKEKLLQLYIELSQNKPPRGDAKSWKMLTGNIVAAAKDVVNDKEGATKKLEKATTCAACHGKHKPKEED